MTASSCFPAVSRGDAQILILGTLPGVESLKQQRYYAHPRNAFWPIMGALYGASPDIVYDARLEILKNNRIALWDVCACARREGSLDSNIQAPVPNDFAAFFATHPLIGRICFNGQPAEQLFRRLRSDGLPVMRQSTLPSTSPAHARMGFEEKLVRWRDALVERAPPMAARFGSADDA
jgi:TDG/mug DNA glycosylase family protein